MTYEIYKEDIKFIRIKKYRFSKTKGAVKIYPIRRNTVNYHLEGIKDIEEVSKIIEEKYKELIKYK